MRHTLRYVFALAYTGLLLWADSHLQALLPQHLLGVVTFAYLIVLAQGFSPQDRREMWCCVVFSTAMELFATQAWGLYHYRFGNVPLYVPPGHGLIYIVSLGLTREPFFQRHDRAIRIAVLAISTAWAAAGLFVFPRWTGHLDVHGALYWPFFAWFLIKSEQGSAFAPTFLFASLIELLGVQLGTWHWSPVMPYLGFPAGDPPSVVAGGYCFFGFVAIGMASLSFARASAGSGGA